VEVEEDEHEEEEFNVSLHDTHRFFRYFSEGFVNIPNILHTYSMEQKFFLRN